MHPSFILILTLFPLCDSIFGFGRLQSIAVEGTLKCKWRLLKDVKVKLYDKGLIFDKKLDETRTNEVGKFRLSGSKREYSKIDPKINIYHKCEYDGRCYKKVSLDVRKAFITEGGTPNQTHNFGTIDLAQKFDSETIDCIN